MGISADLDEEMRIPASKRGRNLFFSPRFAQLLLALLFAPALAPAADQTAALTTLGQVHALSLEEGAKALPVKARAVVTFCNPDLRVLFLQDDSCAVSVRFSADRGRSDLDFQPGQLVEIEGATTLGRLHCNVRAQHLRGVGAGKMPPVLNLNRQESFEDSTDCRLVQIKGYVPGVVKFGTRLNLELIVRPGLTLQVVITEGETPEARELAGSLVEASGVFAFQYDATGKKIGGRLYVTGIAGIRKLDSIPISTVGDVVNGAGRGPTREPFRIRATVLNHNLGHSVMVRDSTGTLRVPLRDLTYQNPGTQVEIFAWPLQCKPELLLTNVSLKPAIADAPLEEAAVDVLTPAAANTNLPTLTNISQIRKLSPQQAARGYPAQITGVITYFNGLSYLHFVQDDSAGIYFDVSGMPTESGLVPGQKIEIEGFSGPGDYAPLIMARRVRVVGPGAMPAPEPATFQKLMTGGYDSQWVLLKGVVRNQWNATNMTTLALFTGDAVIKVNVPRVGSPPSTNLVDAAVEIEGVCSSIIDDRRRLQGVELQTPDWDHVRIEHTAIEDPFRLPVKGVASLFEFHAGAGDLHRIRLMGIAISGVRDGSFYLQDASGGIEVQPQEPSVSVAVGAAIDVVGFPVVIDKHPMLQNALIKPISGGTPLEPFELKPDSALEPALHGTLVRLEGTVRGHFSRASEELFTVQFGSSIIDVILDKGEEDQFEDIVPGSGVRLTGVYLALNQGAKVQSFELLLRTSADLRVISRPSWWTFKHTFWVLGGLLAMLILGLGWVLALRRQVRQRTLQLHQEIELHKRTEAKLEGEIAQRQLMETEVDRTHQQLIAASRQAGMAEVATSVLHNVGNVLNSVNVSAHLLNEKIKASKIDGLARVVRMLQENSNHLGEFLAQDPGRQLPQYLAELSAHLAGEQRLLLKEIESLEKNIDHIKLIVAAQQNSARILGVAESVDLPELVEDALRMNEESLVQQGVQVVRDYAPGLPRITMDKHKALQVIANLIRNAKNACQDSRQPANRLTLRIAQENERVRISVTDNGVGIAQENLTRIFNHGFTTRKDGHGFGLHSGALAAKEMGGTLTAFSEGLGKGATFTLDLPAPVRLRQNFVRLASQCSCRVISLPEGPSLRLD